MPYPRTPLSLTAMQLWAQLAHSSVSSASDLAQALLEGKDEDEADEVQLPPIPVEDVKRLAKSAGRSTVRECTVTHIRCTGTPLPALTHLHSHEIL